ncbi:MAG: ATP-binding cassette domain-containing protein [Arhodomonas sp.]|nr:ATP-binding cassette domain-containing protein [Arhodomonas sp.]
MADDLSLEDIALRHAPWMPAVLEDVDLRVPAGSRVAVVGPSGSGKSSIADLCARLIDPTSGTVRLGGTDLRQLEPSLLHGRLAYLTQRGELFDDTIAGNLRIAQPGAGEPALWRALEVAGLASFVADLPAGLDTWVGESGRRLSGGQGRRLALARVVLRDAPVVLLDEPFTGLDGATAAEVAERLDQWLAGRTALLLAHSVAALPSVEYIHELRDGRLHPLRP